MKDASKHLRHIFSLVMFLNENTPADVFLTLSPHVSRISIGIYNIGWDEDKPLSESIGAYYKECCWCTDPIKEVSDLTARLEKMVQEHVNSMLD